MKEFNVRKNMKKFIYFNSLEDELTRKNMMCCFITIKLDEVMVSIGVEQLKSINNRDSPKKKKNIQKDNNMQEVSLEVNAVNWYL